MQQIILHIIAILERSPVGNGSKPLNWFDVVRFALYFALLVYLAWEHAQ